jgi:hypothetical protein
VKAESAPGKGALEVVGDDTPMVSQTEGKSALRLALDEAMLEIPEAEPDDDYPLPLVDSDDDFAEQCRALIDSKAYRVGGDR